MGIIRDEIRADYLRMGVELTEEAITEMAWEAALEETAREDEAGLYRVLAHDEVETAWEAARDGDDDHDWDDDHVWATGPGPGYDDSPEHNDRISRHQRAATRRMDVVLPVHGGGYRAYKADLTHRQAVSLRSLTLTTWLASMATHADGLLKEGHGPFTILACDDRDRAHLFRLETDGTVHHTPPRD